MIGLSGLLVAPLLCLEKFGLGNFSTRHNDNLKFIPNPAIPKYGHLLSMTGFVAFCI